MDGLGGGVGLAADHGGVLAVGLGDGVAHGRGVAQLDGLGVGLVRGHRGDNKGSDENLINKNTNLISSNSLLNIFFSSIILISY